MPHCPGGPFRFPLPGSGMKVVLVRCGALVWVGKPDGGVSGDSLLG